MSVIFDITDHVARVTIDRPDRMNAIDTSTHRRLGEIWDEVEANPDIRCAVLTGSGDRAFSAGADLKDDTGMSGVDYWSGLSRDGYRGISLRQMSTPVIARVNGLALGGGLEMVLGCDIVIAADTARFALPEAKVGRVPLDGSVAASDPAQYRDGDDDDGPHGARARDGEIWPAKCGRAACGTGC
jgi:crotonobetainyl-CoA hydratase